MGRYGGLLESGVRGATQGMPALDPVPGGEHKGQSPTHPILHLLLLGSALQHRVGSE